jgi:hypothetical protein
MLETYRFVGIFAKMHPPNQLVPEDHSREKVITTFKLRIYLTRPMLRMCIARHAHPQSGLLGKKITFKLFLYLQLLHYLIFSIVFFILSVTT